MGNDFQRLDEALDRWSALEGAAAEAFRESFLRVHPELADRFNALVDAMGAVGPLDQSVQSLSVLDELAADTDTTAVEFGPYRAREILGEGGMGRVYRAERSDGEFEAEVAIKVIRSGMERAEILRRFASERDILARIDHPGIARLRDAGTADDGSPYIVMDFVPGRPLLSYADAHRLRPRDRIELALKICDAVAHAHDRHVIHRDIKPSNILVREDGRPVLLDFGIAKVLVGDADRDEDTRAVDRVYTPRWAAPEQLSGDVVGPATDVFAVGLLLHNLLSGKHPQRESTGGAARDLRLHTGVAEDVARSRKIPRRRLRRLLRGDLRVVIEKATRAEPRRRYPSVRVLATDLRAVLDGRPISARSGRAYRWGKFVARNRALVALWFTATCLLVAYAVTTTLQARALATERDRAQRQARRAEASVQFLDRTLLQGVAGQPLSDDVTVLSLLERARAQLDPRSPEGVELLLLTARGYAALGRHAQARDLADQVVAAGPAVLPLADSRNLEALRVSSRASANLLLYREAETSALEMLRRTLRAHGVGSLWLSKALVTLAEAVDDVSSDRAAYLYGTAAAVELLHGVAAPDTFADALVGFGFCLRTPGDLGSFFVRTGLKVRRMRHGNQHLQVADALHKLAMTVSNLDDRVQLLQEALAIERQTAGANHVRVANTLNDLALVLEFSEPEGSVRLLREALELAARQYAPDHPRLVTGVLNLGAVLREQGELDEASRIMAPVLARLEPGTPTRGVLAYHLALVRQAQGDDAAAVVLLLSAFEEVLEGSYTADRLAAVAVALADALAETGSATQAREILERAVAGLERKGTTAVVRAPVVRRMRELGAHQGKATAQADGE